LTIYKRSFVVTLVISVISFLIAAILNYAMQEQFWCNVLLGIFGGAVLTSITSIIGYFVERRHALEEFYLETIKLLKRYNKYQTDLTLDKKINFFLELSNYDMEYWGTTYARIDLFNKKSKKYIYEKIYSPLTYAHKKACSHTWNFEMHVNDTGVNNAAMKEFVSEIEPAIIREEERVVGNGDNEYVTKNVHNHIVEIIDAELNGKYYEIMYGKKKAEENRKEAEENRKEAKN
jgi:hypothetical protein